MSYIMKDPGQGDNEYGLLYCCLVFGGLVLAVVGGVDLGIYCGVTVFFDQGGNILLGQMSSPQTMLKSGMHSPRKNPEQTS